MMNDGTRYPGMVKDAVLGGCLFAVAAVLRDSDVSSVLSAKGFRSAAWITFSGACGLIIRSFANNMARKNRELAGPSDTILSDSQSNF